MENLKCSYRNGIIRGTMADGETFSGFNVEQGFSYSVYKLNVQDIVEEEKQYHLEEYEEAYNPTESGKCYFDPCLSMWMMDNDWYMSIKIGEDDFRDIQSYLQDAYETIGVENWESRKPDLIFNNDCVVWGV